MFYLQIKIMVVNFLKNLRHEKLKKFSNFWLFLGNLYRNILIKTKYSVSCSKNISNFGPFNFHPIFLFSDYDNWGGNHNNLYQKMITMSLKKKCIIDIGTHIGLNIIPIGVISSGKVEIHCFEPSDINLSYLRYHVEKNKIKNIIINNLVVGSKARQKVVFYEKEVTSGLNSILKLENKGHFDEKYKIQTSLDHYCFKKNIVPELIKIDAEGSEIEILMGSRKIIKKYKPIIFLSLHPFHIKKLGNKIKDLKLILKEIDYDIFDKSNAKPKNFKLDEYLLVPKNVK